MGLVAVRIRRRYRHDVSRQFKKSTLIRYSWRTQGLQPLVHPVKPSMPAQKSGLQLNDQGERERSSTVASLFLEHNRVLVGFLFARLKNEQEAKEIAQEAYVKVLELERRPGATHFLRAYLFRVAEHLALDRLRQRRIRSRLDQLDSLDDLFEAATAERVAIAEQELALLNRAVLELPSKCRQAFRMHKLEDRPFSEVAQRMSLTERMVRKHVSRAVVYILLRREGNSPKDAWAQVKS
jgi:RNA polymerase sigma factor (sigma-70 family)